MNRPLRIATFCATALFAVPFGASHAIATDDTTPNASSTSTTEEFTTIAPTTTTLPPVSPPQRGRAAIGFARIILDEQRAYIFNNRRRLIATLPVSTGTDDQTPVGTFKVYSKSAQTYFSPDPSERMRWMTRFTKGREGAAIGFHGVPFRVTKSGEVPIFTPLGEYPVSHGCIRVRVADAKWIYDNMNLGTTVSVLRTRR
ncbi:MAG: L,D-transpeptidase [Actinomycetes bacterium]|jgi:lipoprotein-anchoring transpeptidase ErfK/SrfK